jgi:hypothetical protein
MKKLLEKADRLLEIIEMGLLTKQAAMFRLKELRAEIAEEFGEGSDNFMACMYPLIEAHETVMQLFGEVEE